LRLPWKWDERKVCLPFKNSGRVFETTGKVLRSVLICGCFLSFFSMNIPPFLQEIKKPLQIPWHVPELSPDQLLNLCDAVFTRRPPPGCQVGAPPARAASHDLPLCHRQAVQGQRPDDLAPGANRPGPFIPCHRRAQPPEELAHIIGKRGSGLRSEALQIPLGGLCHQIQVSCRNGRQVVQAARVHPVRGIF